MIQKFLLTLSFFTRIPAGKQGFGKLTLADCAVFFPIMGAFIGLIIGVFYISALYIGITNYIAAWLSIIFYLLLTGGLHEDGLADTADGLASGRSREQKLAIMRDSHIGSYGVLALITIIALKSLLISELTLNAQSLYIFIIAAAVSRAFMVLIMRTMPYARNDGLAATCGKPTEINTLVTISIASSTLLLATSPTTAFSCVTALFITYIILRYVFNKHFGGITGDTLGASQQVGEVLLFMFLTY
ncbi:MAG: adenosylcobinamide-GDP ribazoletransferase [Rickettsiales bacterium]